MVTSFECGFKTCGMPDLNDLFKRSRIFLLTIMFAILSLKHLKIARFKDHLCLSSSGLVSAARNFVLIILFSCYLPL